MQTSLACSLLALAGSASITLAQAPLFSNGSPNPDVPALSTGGTTINGFTAPLMSTWGEVTASSATEANAHAGFSTHLYGPNNSYRFSDDFIVPNGQTWRIDAINFYAYQPLAVIAPFASVNLEIWQGRPDLPGSTRLFGDTITNRLTAATPTNIYRIFNQTVQPAPTVPDATRRIWRAAVNAGQTTLPAGTYWLTWQIIPISPDGVIFSPAVTIPGQRTAAGWNALLLRPTGWAPALDAGKPDFAPDLPQDFPFMLVGVTSCAVDYNRDGFLNQEDLTGFLTAFLDESVPPGPSGTSNSPCPGEPAPYDTFGYAADYNRDCSFNQEDLSGFITEYFSETENPNNCIPG